MFGAIHSLVSLGSMQKLRRYRPKADLDDDCSERLLGLVQI
jgi:hypothetical protein